MKLRLAFSLSFLSLGLVHAQGAKEAQALFEAMEAKVASAKAIKVSYESEIGLGGTTLELKGELLLGPNNAGRVSLKGNDPSGQAFSMRITSDGTQIAMLHEQGGQAEGETSDAPPNFTSALRASLCRMSMSGALLMGTSVEVTSEDLEDEGEAEVEEIEIDVPVTNFSMGEKEREGNRSLQVIEFDVTASDKEFHTKLWIDTTTGLPAKRVLDSPEQKTAITETYTAFELEPTLPKDAFRVGEGDTTQAPTSQPAK